MTTLRRFELTPIALALALLGGPATAASWTYTLDADFDGGVLTGVNHNAPNNNQLQLNVTGTSFPVLWIANAGEDTLSKIDSNPFGTMPGREIARYRTWFNAGGYDHGAWAGTAPSRTAVDAQGNAYVLNRAFGGYPTVFKILNNTFIDRNGNGSVDTSTDTSGDGHIQAGEMMPLQDTNGNGVIDPSEIKDERIAWVRRVPDGSYNNGATRYDGIGRALCLGVDGNLWVGLYNNREYYKIDATDGHTIAGPVTTAYQNYGCLIDQNGTLWGANWDTAVLTRIANTTSNTGPYPVQTLSMPAGVYGLALRRDASNTTHVIMGGSCSSYVEHVDGGATTTPAQVGYCGYAVGTDNNGNITVSKRDGGVVKFDPSGAVLWDKGSQVGSADSRGVIADANNNIWQVHRASNNIAKYSGVDGSFLGVLGVGYEPYTYSDASGTAALSVTTHTGKWQRRQDGGTAGMPWTKVAWNATVPSGAGVVTEVRSGNDPVALDAAAFTPVTASGAALAGVSGRYLDVRVTLTANAANQSPVVYDVTVTSAPPVCDVNQDGVVDISDLNLIRTAIGQTPTAGDPRDATGDGKITINDVRACTFKCTNTNCVPPAAP